MEQELSAVAQVFSAIFQKSVLPKQQIMAAEAEKRAKQQQALPPCCKGKNKLALQK